jgi:hypothetical protein
LCSLRRQGAELDLQPGQQRFSAFTGFVLSATQIKVWLPMPLYDAFQCLHRLCALCDTRVLEEKKPETEV